MNDESHQIEEVGEKLRGMMPWIKPLFFVLPNAGLVDKSLEKNCPWRWRQ
jgi:hypothetical protein